MTNGPTADIAQRVIDRRDRLGLNQAELAARAGVHPSYVSRLESRKSGLDIEELKKIAHALAWTVSDLIGETDEAVAGEIRRRASADEEVVVLFEKIATGMTMRTDAQREYVKRSLEVLANLPQEKSE